MTHSILFIDSQVLSSETLLPGLDSLVRVVYLDANRSGIEQINEVLASESGLDSVQILSHGSAGGLQLGADWVNSASLETHRESVQQWGNALKDSSDILLLSCNVGAGEEGQTFINRLSQFTHADVAASDDLMGKGGDWDLEAITGAIEAKLALQNTAAYSDTLGILNVSVTDDDGSGNTVNTLSWAIEQANLTAEDDDIQLNTDVKLVGFVQEAINSNINFVGNNHIVSGNELGRPFFVRSGTVSFNNMTIDKGRSVGSNGGGGGAGMGGGLFVYDGNVTVNNVTFSNNQAEGGDGNAAIRAGGGKLGGVGGGKGGAGGAGTSNGTNGTGTNAGTGGAGNAAGNAASGADGGFGGGGGGGGGGSNSGGKGGAGGFGGGGGGGGNGTVNSFGKGGNGGFGGGGGNSAGLEDATGGFGGFGGGTGRGGPSTDFRNGGFGGGKGANGIAGGGAGMGGAIFIRSGNLTVANSRFDTNTATGGAGTNAASNGAGLGGAIFALQTTTNSNDNNQSMPTALPTVRLRKNTFISNTAANDEAIANPIALGNNQNNDNLFGTQFQILNAIPTASNNTIAVAVDSAIALTSAFPFADADTDDSLQVVKIVAAPLKGQLFNDANSNSIADGGEAIASGTDIAFTSLANLKFRPLAGESGINYASIQFQVSDGIDFSNINSLTINVTPSGGGGGGGDGVTGIPLAPFKLAAKAKTIADTAGTNKLVGTNKAERLRGLKSNDRITAKNGNDLLDGGAGNDNLRGQNDNDQLLGGKGNDKLIGGNGDDILIGGAGQDTLTGNAGKDMFVFEKLSEGIDTITDFENSIDVIDVRKIFSQAAFAGATPLARFQQFAQFVQVGANTEFRIDADGNGAGTNFTTLAVLNNVLVGTVGSGNVVIV